MSGQTKGPPRGVAISTILAGLPLLDGMPESQRNELAGACKLLRLPKGHPVFLVAEQPRDFHLLIKGGVQLWVSCNGQRKTLSLVKPYEFVCYAATILGVVYPHNAETISEASVLAIQRDHLIGLICGSSPLSSRMLEGLSRRILTLRQSADTSSQPTCLGRVAGYLLQFAPRVDTPRYELSLPVAKQAVASHLNMSKETLSRALKALREAGLLQVHGRTVNVLDREALTRIQQTRHVQALPPAPALVHPASGPAISPGQPRLNGARRPAMSPARRG